MCGVVGGVTSDVDEADEAAFADILGSTSSDFLSERFDATMLGNNELAIWTIAHREIFSDYDQKRRGEKSKHVLSPGRGALLSGGIFGQ